MFIRNRKLQVAIVKNTIEKVEALLQMPNSSPGKVLAILAPLAGKKNVPWPVYYYIGIAYMHKKDFKTALRWLKKALPGSRDRAITYHAISICHYNLSSFEEAESLEKQALDKEEFYNGWKHLGMIYRARAELKQALDCYKKAAVLEPENSELVNKIAEIYRDQGRLNKAIELFEYSTGSSEDPTVINSSNVALAQILIQKNKYDDAKKALDKVLKEDQKNVNARIILSDLFRKRGDYKQAISLCRQLLKEDAKMAKVRLNLGVCLQEMARFDEAEEQYMRALKDDPEEYQSLSNYLMCIHYNPKRTKEEIFEAHKLWDQYFGRKERPKRPTPVNKNPDKKLKIGFLSGGFMCHPVGWMITRGLEHLPEDKLEIYCYTTGKKHDYITNRINQAADYWRSVVGYNDEIIAGMIEKDEIDILVELSGHAADNRLRTITMEPAPVIVKWVGGLFNTTGLESVDYLISDWHESPEGEEKFYTEKLVRLPDDYVCYMPPVYAPDVEPLPYEKNNYITFGCFNNPSKVNNEILDRWGEILNKLPESRLLLKSKQYETDELKRRIIKHMERAGISSDRLIFRGETNHKKHLECYNEVDIALDPWPYSGGVTTCEALWMGVPVVTKPGPTFAGRHSATHLHNAGFPHWVVDSWEEYIRTVLNMAENVEQLTDLRKTLRSRVAESPLCSARRFAAHLSEAFREMWKQHVAIEGGSTNRLNHISIKSIPEEEIEQRTGDRRGNRDIGFNLQDQDLDKSEELEMTVEISSVNGMNEKSKMNNGFENPGMINDEVNQKNGREENKHQNRREIYRIETKYDLTVCTPANLNMLTPYVLLENEEWFEPEWHFLREFLQPGMKAVDAGASFGVYSLPIAKKVGDNGKVYAFEPGRNSRRFLEMSKSENDLQNVEVFGYALADQWGKGRFIKAQTPELNVLDSDGEEEVEVTTLDKWWKSIQKPTLDFIKFDVNGFEKKVLAGAENVLTENSPLLMINIGEVDKEELIAISTYLKEKEYALYEYVPGPGLLSEIDLNEELDPYLMNLIAVSHKFKNDFMEKGWIYDESIEIEEPGEANWEKVLSEFPWCESKMELWKALDKDENHKYLKALNTLCAAEQLQPERAEDCSIRSQKGKLLEEAAKQFVKLFNNGDNGFPVSMCLSRILNYLGRRGQAVAIMARLMRDNRSQTKSVSDRPFLLPVTELDALPVHTDFDKWLTVRTVESWVALKNVSTYFCGEEELTLFGMLDKNPEAEPSTKRKGILINKLHGISFDKDLSFNFDLNDWFWKPLTNHTEQTSSKINPAHDLKNLPSEIIDAKVKVNGSKSTEPVTIKIPKREVFRLNNIFQKDEYRLPKGVQITENSVIVDVGANVGAFAIYASMWNSNANIYCFEPNPQVTPLLDLNTQHFPNIERHYSALGEADGELSLYQHPYNTGESTTSQQIKGGKKVKVEVRKSGELLKERGISEIDVLKIDTEGAEVPILAGMKDFLPYTKVVMLEYHSEEDRRKIDEMLSGFQLYSAEVQELWGIGTVKYINRHLLKN